MKLYHETDVAIEPIDDRDSLEKAIQINDEFYIPSCAMGKVMLAENIQLGKIVYFDPRMMVEIKDLNLVIVDFKSVLMEAE